MSDKPKKIAIVYSGAKSWGGVETYLELLFTNADRAKVNLMLLSLGSWPLTRKLPNAEYRVRTFAGSRFRPQTIFELSKSLREDGIDLVVSQGTVANAYARAAALISGVPNLVVVHSDSHFDYPMYFARVIYSIVEKLTRFPTRRYIAVSKYLKEKLITSGISAGKITVVYNGVSPYPSNVSEKLETNSSHTGSNSKITIGSIGRLHKVKNYVELIRAVGQLPTANCQLLIYGEGEEKKALQKLIDELGLADRVKLCGYAKDLSEALSNTDYYVQPSLSEGFGLTVVEAMLAGKPVIVSPYGALPELVENDKTGIIMQGANHDDIIDAINDLLLHKDKAERLAVAGQKFAQENFGVERFVKETEKIFVESAK